MIEKGSHNWEAECEKLRKEMQHMEAKNYEEKDHLKRRIAELEQALMIYEQKWSVIELIFGK
jgi:predicted  nucleic acid-binding Zn-ribbon protein